MELNQSPSPEGPMQHSGLEGAQRTQRALPSSLLESSRMNLDAPSTSPIPTRSTEAMSVTTTTATEADAKPRGRLAQIDQHIARLPNRQFSPPSGFRNLHERHLRSGQHTNNNNSAATGNNRDKESLLRSVLERRTREHTPPAQVMDALANGLGAMSTEEQGRTEPDPRPRRRQDSETTYWRARRREGHRRMRGYLPPGFVARNRLRHDAHGKVIDVDGVVTDVHGVVLEVPGMVIDDHGRIVDGGEGAGSGVTATSDGQSHVESRGVEEGGGMDVDGEEGVGVEGGGGGGGEKVDSSMHPSDLRDVA